MPIKFENSISIGNMGTLGVLVVSFVVGWTQMQAQLINLAEKVAAQEAATKERISVTTVDRAEKDSRLRALEVQASGFGSELKNIQAGISRIENNLDNLIENGGKP